MNFSIGAVATPLYSAKIYDTPGSPSSFFTSDKIYWYRSDDQNSLKFYSVLTLTPPIDSALERYGGIIYSPTSDVDSNIIDEGKFFVSGERLNEDVTIDFDTNNGLEFLYIDDPTANITFGSKLTSTYRANGTQYSLNSKVSLNKTLKAIATDAMSIEGAARVHIESGTDTPQLIFSSQEDLNNSVTITGGRGFVTIDSGISLTEISPSESLKVTASRNTSLEFSGDFDFLQTIVFAEDTRIVSIIGSAGFIFSDDINLASGKIALGGAASQFGDICGNGVILSSDYIITSLDEVGDFVEIAGVYSENTSWNFDGGITRYEVTSDGLHVESSNESGSVIFSQTINKTADVESWSISADRNLFHYNPPDAGSQTNIGSETQNLENTEIQGSSESEISGSNDINIQVLSESESGSYSETSISTDAESNNSIDSNDLEIQDSHDSNAQDTIGTETQDSSNSIDNATNFYFATSNFDNILSISSANDGKTFNLTENQADAFIISPPSKNAYITIENVEFDENDTLILNGFNIDTISADNLVAGGKMIFESNGFSVTLDGTTSAKNLDASILHVSDESHNDQILTWANKSNSTLDFSDFDSAILHFDNTSNNFIIGTQFNDTIHAGLNDSIFGGGGLDEILNFNSTNMLILDAEISNFFTNNDDLLIQLKNNSSIRLEGVVGFIDTVQIFDSSNERRFSINVPTT